MAMNFDTPDGRGEIDSAICKLSNAKDGDTLLVRYDGYAGPSAAYKLRDAIFEACRALPEDVRKKFPRVSLVVCPMDLDVFKTSMAILGRCEFEGKEVPGESLVDEAP